MTGPTSLSENWPTDEMNVRGTTENFYVALPIAFFSGLGVAVSLLDDQTSSLVGVAISASLLPPAVNAGLLWITYIFAEKNVVPPTQCQLNTTENFNATLENLNHTTDNSVDDEIEWISCAKWFNNSDSDYNWTIWIDADEFANATAERIHCLDWFNVTDNEDSLFNSTTMTTAVEADQGGRRLFKRAFRPTSTTGGVGSKRNVTTPEDLCTVEEIDEHKNEFYDNGAISLLLTLANIFLIWLSGMLMFRIKEILPVKKTVFWEDLGIARKVYTERAVLSSEHYTASTKKKSNDEAAPSTG